MENNRLNSENILLSIIIPHYNTPILLEKLILSVPYIQQIETIVIDDNSTIDNGIYSSCVEKYGNRNVLFLKNSISNRGAGNARNVGIDHAKGKWILFADADDYFTTGWWDIVSRYLNNDHDIIFFSPTSLFLNTKKESDRHTHYANLVKNFCNDNSHENEIKLRTQYWSPWSKLIKKELIDKNKIRFDGTIHSNDMMFSTKVGYLANRIYAVDDVVYCITDSNNSLTAHKDLKSMRIRDDVYYKYYFYLYNHYSRNDMKLLGFGLKDWLYFWLYRFNIIQIRDFIVRRKLLK